jgi:hypothetical protein
MDGYERPEPDLHSRVFFFLRRTFSLPLTGALFPLQDMIAVLFALRRRTHFMFSHELLQVSHTPLQLRRMRLLGG